MVVGGCVKESVLGGKDGKSGGILFPGHGINSELPGLSLKNNT